MDEEPVRPDARFNAKSIARVFHDTYERLAPKYGYETRKDSAVPWEQVPEKNRRLMIAVVERLLSDSVIAVAGRCKYRHDDGRRCTLGEHHISACRFWEKRPSSEPT